MTHTLRYLPVLLLLLLAGCDTVDTFTAGDDPLWQAKLMVFNTPYTIECDTRTGRATMLRTLPSSIVEREEGTCTTRSEEGTLHITSEGITATAPRNFAFTGILSTARSATGELCIAYLTCTTTTLRNVRTL